MEMTKVVKPFIRRVLPNTFGNIVYIQYISYNINYVLNWLIYTYNIILIIYDF